MSRVVLDASALLAILNQEPGAEKLTPELLSTAAISTVKFAVQFGKIDGADSRGAQELRRQLFGSGFLIENGEQGGSVQHNPTHFGRPRGVRRSIRPRERCPASHVCGPAAEPAPGCVSKW